MIIPLTLWSAGALASAGTIAAAYLYRRRSRVVDVPAVENWVRVGRPVEPRSVATLFRSFVSLAFQLLVILLVAGAILKSMSVVPQTRQLAIVLDCGATMQSTEGSTSRFELARDLTRRTLNSLPSDCRVYVIQAAHRPIVARPSSTDAIEAAHDLGGLSALDVDSDVAAAIRAAAAYVGNDAAAQVLVISDFSGDTPIALKSAWKSRAALRFERVGMPHTDVAVTNLWQERAPNGTQSVGITVESRGITQLDVPITIRSQSQIAWSGRTNLREGRQALKFPLPIDPRTTFEIEVSASDSLSVDNVAFGVTPAARKIICLITPRPTPIENAIRADPTARLRVVKPQDFQPQPSDGLIVVNDAEVTALATGVPALFVGASDLRDGIRLDSDAPVDRVSSWIEHPVLKDLEPDLIRIFKACRTTASLDRCTTVMSAQDIPLMLACERSDSDPARSRSICWLFHLNETDLATRPAFPVLLWNTLDYLSGESEDASTSQSRTGQPLEVAAVDSSVVDPSGRTLPLSHFGSRAAATDVTTQGIYHLNESDQTRAVAVNLLSERGVTPLDSSDATADAAASVAGHHDSWLSLQGSAIDWRLLAGAAVMVACIEWLLFHRGLIRVA